VRNYAIIVAGGTGSRMKSALPKQFHLLQGKPVLYHTIKAFLTAIPDIRIVVVIPREHQATVDSIMEQFPELEFHTITTGGLTRFDSVKNGLRTVPEDSIVFVHDGVRCLVQPDLILRCRHVALSSGNAVPAIAATDSVRIATAEGNRQVNRNAVRLVQTPQTFQSTILKQCYARDYHDSFTDDASVIEAAGYRINLVDGEATNIKITWPIDLIVADEILKARTTA
jgi:2-C-methyl-D-erythritol 4-phosphate cytidylyltransferase